MLGFLLLLGAVILFRLVFVVERQARSARPERHWLRSLDFSFHTYSIHLETATRAARAAKARALAIERNTLAPLDPRD